MYWNLAYDVLIFLVSVFIVICIYGKWKHRYFVGTGVKCIQPPLPFMGNNIKALMGLEPLTKFTRQIYNRFPDQKYENINTII